MLRRLGKALEAWSPDAALPSNGQPHLLLAAVWEDAVGPELAAQCYPARISDGTLTVLTRSSAWSQQLSFFSERIVAAVQLRLPQTPVHRLRFRVGKLPVGAAGRPFAREAVLSDGRCDLRPAALSAAEAVSRFRQNVEERKRAKRDAGWKECSRCAASIAPGGRALCMPCTNAGERRREAAVAMLLFDAPWMGFCAISQLVDGLRRAEYDDIVGRTLARWWETLCRARAAKRLSADGRERLIASSYVLLKSGIAPETIEPATLRNVLGEELHDLLYANNDRT